MISKELIENDLKNLIELEFPDEYTAEFTWNSKTIKAAKGMIELDKEIEGGYVQEYDFSVWAVSSDLVPKPEVGKDVIVIDGKTYVIININTDDINIRLDLQQEVQAL